MPFEVEYVVLPAYVATTWCSSLEVEYVTGVVHVAVETAGDPELTTGTAEQPEIGVPLFVNATVEPAVTVVPPEAGTIVAV